MNKNDSSAPSGVGVSLFSLWGRNQFSLSLFPILIAAAILPIVYTIVLDLRPCGGYIYKNYLH